MGDMFRYVLVVSMLLSASLAFGQSAPAIDEATGTETATDEATDAIASTTVQAPQSSVVEPSPPSEPTVEPAAEPVYESTVLGRKSRQARITGAATAVTEETLKTFSHDDVQKVLKHTSVA